MNFLMDASNRSGDVLSVSDLASEESRSTATPMMEQFIEIKANNPDSLLFYRMGDFYELFFQDAVEASRALGITLTKRGQHMGQEIPMCGVPVHAADDYLQKLIASGYRVAVCEQVEDPAEAKKRGSKSVVRRDVVRLVTPGTITEDKLLSPSESNYLMALARIRSGSEPAYALAWIDISTGIFRLAETAESRLLADILRIEPRELILPDTVFHDPDLRPVFDVLGRVAVPQPAVLFDSATAEGRISRYYGVGTLDGFGSFSRAELAAASAAVSYVEKTQLQERPALGIPERESAASTLFIDPATRANLELAKTLSGSRDGSLLKSLDRTMTSGGARLLAERLMSPLTDPERINQRLDSIEVLADQPRFTTDVRDALRRAPDMPRALSRLALGRGGPRDLGAIQAGMRAAAAISALLSGAELSAELTEARDAIAALPGELLARLDATLAEELPLLKRDGGFVREGASAELDEMRALRDQSRRVIAGLQLQYCEETGIKSLKIKHNNVLGYFIEVTAGNAGSMTDTDAGRARFIHRQTMANAMRFTTTELAELETKIANAADRALAIELETFEAMVREVVAEAEAIKAAALALATIDVSAGLAVLAEEQNYTRPTVDRSRMFAIDGGRHPVVEQALRRQAANPFVANGCDLSPPNGEQGGAIWLLTGPNMGGKSTFLRQNALIAIMAQTGSFVPAAAAHIGVVDRLFSRVGASDDLARGRSTFMVEMVETAAILNQATDRSLVILDEIGRGTATFDGLSIAWAAVEHLHEVNRCRGLFATHFHELTVLSEKLVRLSNATMRVKEWDGDVIFLHEVGPGAADRSYGIQVARLAGLPASVVARARDVLAKLEDADRKNPASQLIDDLPLFQVAVRREEAARASSGPSKVEEALKALNPDDMTPREALDALYALKKELSNR
ncbi:DNA mismatch repair protein MutS [Sinorhizobium meliloti]|jgi:DNA mismatch repair protein MutS|uniref:DNA mismatch repair protein MutS n=12 Tax=Rhizobium meliloti TaxID=382 RepID=MUTS_RHIME|nr:DNA mismatch repair protein MutS [Sinorhizobium meliloti]P56883.1 RecName: Full=DNA mismatch repair protein MutS [Sinorhizobium meliloti 1021]PST29446.1 DNA mismatch repair protein MutS [Mesorhizobium loti]TWA99961.1 DNA mismatch repair protein MutS [Ensifer sp. SEMIA 134]TWB34400.1 DNA mismatch repair protein MutS [Ensifer sp. SEMIA 135]AEG02980.1 DNA mismatch repair protein mutS [Sinorhizobium meliloti BL225C]AEG51803.1 DNA mismatch repair protein mutS [Sinorhizobium meliloti AK83]